jgi:hypothetical protein
VHQWLKLSESVSTGIERESEQLCSRKVEGRDAMELFEISHGVSVGKRENKWHAAMTAASD